MNFWDEFSRRITGLKKVSNRSGNRQGEKLWAPENNVKSYHRDFWFKYIFLIDSENTKSSQVMLKGN
ncbi:hypothetical protein C5167_019466 [Papaver somniferum]|uniref:YTH domain-containing protein n=1 Tax=Papaver somniferum TaxID=3469 RepID=A0A4Y7ISC4_PAPSO|nr:hypothetical protein C5167_019466 [Papaver somniferum]